MTIHIRKDDSPFQVVLMPGRGDKCYEGKKPGFYWHNLDEESAIIDNTVTGPFPSYAAAFKDGSESITHKLTKTGPLTYRYGDWIIEYAPKPIPADCGMDWDFVHDNYDGPESPRLCGNAADLRACVVEIDERIEDGCD